MIRIIIDIKKRLFFFIATMCVYSCIGKRYQLLYTIEVRCIYRVGCACCDFFIAYSQRVSIPHMPFNPAIVLFLCWPFCRRSWFGPIVMGLDFIYRFLCSVIGLYPPHENNFYFIFFNINSCTCYTCPLSPPRYVKMKDVFIIINKWK